MIDFKELSTKYDIPTEELERFYNRLFLLVQNEVRKEGLPTVHLQDFGKFYVRKYTIDCVIKAHIKNIRKGVDNAEELKDKIRKLWIARKGKTYNRV